MVKISKLKPGMKIKIVNRWVPGCRQNNKGLMDHWLGQTVTIREVYVDGGFFLIKEDETEFEGNGWYWYPETVARIVTKDKPFPDDEFDPAADLDFLSMLPGVLRKEASHG